jgi:2-polyprenyl-3-methyl-5-hydroxy-6-metoxy-1,4-benzoquinol methylase
MSRFDRLAREWDLKPQRVASAKNVTAKIKSLLTLEGMRLLDYGAGTGLITFNLCEEVSSVIAMDNAKKMLDEIDKKAQNAAIYNVHTRYHDINHEDLPQAQFDLFISSMTMHHIEDTEDFLQKAKASLVEGGYLAINDLESEDGTFHSMGNDDVAHFGFDKEKIYQLLESMGMEIVFLDTVEVISKAKDYPIFLIVAKNV